MRTMRVLFNIALTAVAIGSTAAAASDFDGSKALICATVQALACEAGQECESGLAEDIGAPTFMRIDFASKAVVGPQRTSPIQLMEVRDAQILLQGTELGFAWSIALDRADGRMSATLADRAGAFVLFGACIAP